MLIKKHIDLLGMRVKDSVTGMEGVVTGISFDLYGCIQAIVHPGQKKEGGVHDTRWFDVSRLEVQSNTPVMDVPSFDYGPVAEGKKGPSEKPIDMKS